MVCELESRIRCSFLGLALGDALGANYEGGLLERSVWWLLRVGTQGIRYSDDTQMSLDLAASLIEHRGINQDSLARQFAASYTWRRGYGRGAATMLKRMRRGHAWDHENRRVFPDGSWGNGAAMRAPVIGMYSVRMGEEETLRMAREQAEVTHALATRMALLDTSAGELSEYLGNRFHGSRYDSKLEELCALMRTDRHLSPVQCRTRFGNGVAAFDSTITALYISLIHLMKSFDEMMTYIVQVKGDTDTIGAMAGAIWGAANPPEHLPDTYLKLENTQGIQSVADSLGAMACHP